MLHLFDSPVQPPLGLAPVDRDARVIARATFARGQVGEVDIRNSQTASLVEGDPSSGWASIVSPSVLGTRGGPPQCVALEAMAAQQKGFGRFMGIVQVSNSGNTLSKGDRITIGDASVGRRIYGIALADAANGLCSVLWDGVYGFGQIMAVSGPGNDPPVADLDATPTTIEGAGTVDFDASGSTDDGTIVEYEFDLGQGGGFISNGSSATLDLQYYGEPGTYIAAVRVTDDGTPPLQDVATVTIVVTDPTEPGDPPGSGTAGGDSGDGSGTGNGGDTVPF